MSGQLFFVLAPSAEQIYVAGADAAVSMCARVATATAGAGAGRSHEGHLIINLILLLRLQLVLYRRNNKK